LVGWVRRAAPPPGPLSIRHGQAAVSRGIASADGEGENPAVGALLLSAGSSTDGRRGSSPLAYRTGVW